MKIIKNVNRFDHLKNLLKTNNLILLSGASATGKSFIVEKIISQDPSVTKLLSYTTRIKRNKKDTDYHFVTPAQFDKIEFIQRLEFPTGSGIWYGYSKKELEDLLKSGKKIILILAPKVLTFYKFYFKANQIPFKSVYWNISTKELCRRYVERAGYTSAEELPPAKAVGNAVANRDDLIKREQEQLQDQKLLPEYDFVVDATELIKFED